MTSRHEPIEANIWGGLLRRIARLTRKPEDAEDLLHSAFLRLHDYRQRSSVDNKEGFLVRAAANLSIDEDRKRRVRAEIGSPVHDLIHLAQDYPLQDEVLIVRRRLERVKEGLARLTPRTREIFLMHRIDGLKYRQIAEREGISISAVEKHIARAALHLAEWTEGW